MSRMRLLTAAFLCFLLAAPGAADAGKKRKLRLKAFSSCGSIVAYGTRHLDRVGDVQTGGPVMRPAPGGAEGGGDMQADAPAAPSPAAGTDSSTTNVQEAGIDEPDFVKTDGRRVFVLRAGDLHAVDARADTPRALGSLDIPGDGFDHQMLVHEGKALVVHTEYPEAPQPEPASDTARPASAPAYYPMDPKTVITEVDISDPAAMKVLRTFRADGSFVSGRLTGATARLVLRATPQARYDDTGARRVSRWLPKGTLRNVRTGRKTRHNLVGCRSVRRPAAFSGLDTLTVLTIDVPKGLPAVDSDALMADAETVYASRDSLYVASQRWIRRLEQPSSSTPDIPDGLTTQIHRFDVSDPAQTVYRASGVVPGFLLNQFSLSEHKGVLRVASTDHPVWWGGEVQLSESQVTVLDPREGILRPVGAVTGLGRGERIYAVRFIDDVGYVVTFRQVDPLYTIDLADPTAPRVLGELKITGYSAYLHPAGRDRLIGVGQEASEEGFRMGAQVSLFDVSDLRHPRLLAKHALGDEHSSTDVEYDHHAFLWWPATDLAVLPVSTWNEQNPFMGAVGLRITADGIGEVGRVSHPAGSDEPWLGRVQRSVVVGERVFTISQLGVKASRLDDLSDVGFVAF